MSEYIGGPPLEPQDWDDDEDTRDQDYEPWEDPYTEESAAEANDMWMSYRGL